MDYNSLVLIRGDTEKIKIRFLENGIAYTPKFIEESDIFTFTVRDKQTGKIVLQKSISYPEEIININHEDTASLNFKSYEYDIEYRKPDYSVVKTLVVGSLVIAKEVTY